MLKKFIMRHSQAFLAMALFVGQVSANLACKNKYYQPKVPAQLLKNK